MDNAIQMDGGLPSQGWQKAIVEGIK